MEKQRFFIFIFIALVQIHVFCGQTSGITCGRFSEEYSASKKSGDFSIDTLSMVSKLTKVISKDSFCIDALLTRADLFFLLGKNEAARRDFERVVSLDSVNIYSLYKMGIIYQEDERDDSALVFFQKALELKKSGSLIVTYFNDGVNGINAIGKYDVKAEELIFAQGVSFYYLRNLKSSLQNFDFCISNNYFLAKSHLYRGAIYLEMNNEKKACEDFLNAKRNGNSTADEYLSKYCKK